MASNFQILVRSEGRENLRRAIEIACTNHRVGERGVCWYSIDDEHGLVFHWSLPETSPDALAVQLPFGLDVEGLTDFASRWLAAVKYPREPNIDGSLDKGWEVYTDHWGHVGSWYTAICGIRPCWAEYGK